MLTFSHLILGVMIAMSPTITLKGAVKFSMKKLIAGGEIAASTYTGPGEILFAPSCLGDITTLRLTGNESWNVGKDAFLVATQGIVKEYKNQGISKAMFSGEGFFIYKISGTGIIWISSWGAIIRKDVSAFANEKLCYAKSVCSCRKARSISSTMGTWWPGIVSTCSSALLVGELSLASALVKAWFANSQVGNGQSCP